MGLVLICTGISLFYAKINSKAVYDAVVKWWPLVFVILGLEVLILSCWMKDKGSPLKYDLFSIFIILAIVFCGLGLYSLDGVGATGKINNYLTSQEYRLKTRPSTIPVEPDIEKIVIDAPFSDLKIQTSESSEISSYSYALARAASREAAQHLMNNGAQIVSSRSGKTLQISFNPPAADNIHTTEYIVSIPENIDVELHNRYATRIYTDKVGSDWKIAGGGEVQVFIPRQANLTIRAAVDENSSLGGNVTWEETGTTAKSENGEYDANAKKLAQLKLGSGERSMDIVLNSGNLSVSQL